MSTVYLDSTVLISFLYGSKLEPERADQSQRLIAAVREGSFNAVMSFYALPELYDYVDKYQPANEVSTVFRLSLVELFTLPMTVAPFLDRRDLNHLRQQIKLSDPDDVRHVATALFSKCDAIITFDHDFQQVSNLIPAYTPAEFLATLESPKSAPDVG